MKWVEHYYNLKDREVILIQDTQNELFVVIKFIKIKHNVVQHHVLLILAWKYVEEFARQNVNISRDIQKIWNSLQITNFLDCTRNQSGTFNKISCTLWCAIWDILKCHSRYPRSHVGVITVNNKYKKKKTQNKTHTIQYSGSSSIVRCVYCSFHLLFANNTRLLTV